MTARGGLMGVVGSVGGSGGASSRVQWLVG